MKHLALQTLFASSLVGAVAAQGVPAFYLSELAIDIPGTDQSQEFVEIRGPANTAMTDWYLLTVDGDGVTEDAVARYCRDNLTGYKQPKYIEFRDELPKSNVGKILRRELRTNTH